MGRGSSSSDSGSDGKGRRRRGGWGGKGGWRGATPLWIFIFFVLLVLILVWWGSSRHFHSVRIYTSDAAAMATGRECVVMPASGGRIVSSGQLCDNILGVWLFDRVENPKGGYDYLIRSKQDPSKCWKNDGGALKAAKCGGANQHFFPRKLSGTNEYLFEFVEDDGDYSGKCLSSSNGFISNMITNDWLSFPDCPADDAPYVATSTFEISSIM